MLLKFLRKKKNMKRIMWALAILIIPAFVIWGAGSSKKEKGPDYAGKIFDRKVSFDEYADMWRVSRDHAERTFGANVPPELIDQMAWSRLLLLEKAKIENITVKDSEVIETITSLPVFQREGVFDKKLYKSILGEGTRIFEERLRDDLLISKLRAKVLSGVSVTDEDIKKAYKKKFEKIKASYISLPFSDFEKDVRYNENDLIKFYEQDKENFRRPDEINVKYIEIPFSRFDAKAAVSEEEIKKYFEENISDYKKPGSEETPELDDDIKNKISEKLSLEKKISLAEETAYKVLDKSAELKDLDKVADSLELETKETGFFNMQQEIPDIGWSYEFTKRGFELEPGRISDVFIRTDKGTYVIQLKERKKSYIPEFAQIKESVIESFIKNRSVKIAGKEAEKIYLRIKNETKSKNTFTDIAKLLKKETKATDFIARNDYIAGLGPAEGFVEDCVPLETGEIAGPVKMLESWVILKRDGYQDIDEKKFLEEKEEFKETLLSTKRQEAYNKWFNGLQKEANFVSYTLEE